MKRLFLIPLMISLLTVFSVTANAQDETETARNEEKPGLVEKMLEMQQFVLTATNVRQEASRSFQVQPNLNFIKVTGEDAVIQLGSTSGIGFNGLGGITIDGEVTDYKVEQSDDTYTVNMTISSPSGFFDVFLNTSSQQIAEATVSTINGNQLTFDGELVPPANAGVTTGTTTY